MAEQAAPDRRISKPVTLGVTEPFLTSFWVSLWAGFPPRAPGHPLAGWGFLAPAFESRAAVVAGFGAFAGVLLAGGVPFGYFVVTAGRRPFPHELRRDALRHPDPGRGLLLASSRSSWSRSPSSSSCRSSSSALVRLGILTPGSCGGTGGSGYVVVAAVAVALPGVDPVTTTFEMMPLIILFERSIWLAVLFERRWSEPTPPTRRPWGDV